MGILLESNKPRAYIDRVCPLHVHEVLTATLSCPVLSIHSLGFNTLACATRKGQVCRTHLGEHATYMCSESEVPTTQVNTVGVMKFSMRRRRRGNSAKKPLCMNRYGPMPAAKST